jgi:hypothetical protein
LLTEYSVLRAEINGRIGYIFQIGAVSAVALTWLLQQFTEKYGWAPWLGLVTLVGGIGFYSWQNLRELWRVGGRLIQIEHEVNSRAGEHLIEWETLWGGNPKNVSAFTFLFGKVGPRPRSELPKLDPIYLEREAAAKEGSSSP